MTANRIRFLLVAMGAGALVTGAACTPADMPTDAPVSMSAPAPAPADVDMTVCELDPGTGTWTSDYTTDGRCTFGAPFVPVAPENVTDDDPRFDCRRHGNRVCGPGARVLVVTPTGTVLVPWESAPAV